ncbi:acetylgalactosaminyl-O-glycosyl-glycoprotein beta-1,3-N-acetylglucosaminyltransferase-like isoform X2 [Leguminivora glycinivorella]|uniref:acetylgalactosaminyl-O-glycosyl-glycoprotein beta-1,3-N-acetylglucosaminyltransferase-like isoform X2 n=1 Tax=Leguminivora glycinivorella TaxID=1035111 RepID=UPI00200C2C02|nr:acetylgalactosaminyl-O-glycosyl-glycoprotein beta-1,3-N-acetylglucosaminyltransferase-like isoform X2 [Leguminivora glycinivorella]
MPGAAASLPGAGGRWRSMRCGRARLAPLAALSALTALLLLLPLPPPLLPAPPTARPQGSSTPVTVHEALPTLPPEGSGDDDEALPSGAVRTRDRYVPGHARAHPELCAARGAGTRLVVLVPSAPAHARQRQAVRLTWGHAGRRADVALAFVLGAPPPELRAALDREDALYGDIIEGRHVDSYGNLTLKTLSMLEWFATHCPLAARLLKADDDTFVNVEGVLRFAEAPARRGAARAVWGKVWRAGRPVRNASSKFFVPAEEFPGAVYPAYANGPAYLVAGGAAGALLRAALGSRWLRMEDVLVTGVAAERARVRRADAPAFLRRRKDVAHACALRAALAVHEVSFADQFDLWRKLHDPLVKCPP